MQQAEMKKPENNDIDTIFNEYKKREQAVLGLNRDIEEHMHQAGLT